MAVLTVATVTRAGVVETLVSASAGGDSFPNTGSEYLVVHNGHATDPRTVTIVVQATVDGQAITNKTVTVAALTSKLIGPFPIVTYNDANSRVNLTYSDAAANLTVNPFVITTS